MIVSVLAVIASLAAIVSLLFTRHANMHRIVPSLLYFRHCTRNTSDSPMPQRISLEQWFPMLILLLMLLSILWYATITHEGGKAVFIMDLSAGMRMNYRGHSLFDAASDSAASAITRNQISELMIIAASTTPRLAVPFSTDHARWKDVLAGLALFDGESDIEAAVYAALFAFGPGKAGPVYIFTSTTLFLNGIPAEAKKNIHIIKIPPANDGNVAIVGVNDGRPLVSDLPASVDIANYSARTFRFQLVTKDCSGVTIETQDIAIGSGARERRFLSRNTIQKAAQAGRWFSIEIDVKDALSIDNRAYARFSGSIASAKCGVSSRDQPLLALLRKYSEMNGYQFEVLTGREDAMEQYLGSDFLVFHDVIPPKKNRCPTLLIVSGNGLKQARRTWDLAPARIGDRIFDGIAVDLSIETGGAGDRSPKDPPIFEPVSSSLYSDAVFISPPEITDSRMVCIDSKVMKFNVHLSAAHERLDAAIKLLFNAVQECIRSGGSLVEKTYHCGDIINFDECIGLSPNGQGVDVTRPDGSQIRVSPDQGAFLCDQAGVYRTRATDGSVCEIPVSFYNELISKAENTATISCAEYFKKYGTLDAWFRGEVRRPFKWLVIIIALLMIVEWLWHFKPWKPTPSERAGSSTKGDLQQSGSKVVL
jgi:hypothetical protein